MNCISRSLSTYMGYQPLPQDDPSQETKSSVHDTTSDDHSNTCCEAPILAASRSGNLFELRELLAGVDGQPDYNWVSNLVNLPYPSDHSGELVNALYLAALNGHLDIVQYLTSSVMIAVKNLPVVDQFRAVYSMLNPVCKDGAVPLYAAARNGHLNIVQHMTGVVLKAAEYLPELDKLPAVTMLLNDARNGEYTPLYAAAQNGHLDIVQHIISVLMNAAEHQSQDIPQVEKQSLVRTLLNNVHNDAYTPLYAAAQNGHLDIVSYITNLVMKTADHQTSLLDDVEKPYFILSVLNAPRKDRTTPLYVAAQEGHLKVVQHITSVAMMAVANLLDKNKLPQFLSVLNAARTDGVNTVYAAAQNGHFDIVQYILSAVMLYQDKIPYVEKSPLLLVLNAVRKEDGTNTLYVTARNGYFDIVQFIIKAMEVLPEGEKLQVLNAVCTNGDTPLRIASRNGHLPIVDLLLQQGADPEKRMHLSPFGKYPVLNDSITQTPLKYFLTQTPMQAALKGGHGQVADRFNERKTVATTSAIIPPTSSVTTETALLLSLPQYGAITKRPTYRK